MRDFVCNGIVKTKLGKSDGGVFIYELTKSKYGWHPHCHMDVMLDPENPIEFPFDTRPQKSDKEAWCKLSA
uniref:hypothetical protein n=1 Tax=Pseudoalteromonas sp. TB43-MNA-CIBAN-0091 TaxID=3140416 RepID=UPI003307B236